MMNYDSLRRTSGATSVHDTGNIGGHGSSAFIDWFALAKFTDLVNVEHVDTRTSLFELLNDIPSRLAIINNMFDSRRVCNHFCKCW